MDPQAAQADEARINQARAHAAQHRIGEAEAVYRDILADAPDTPEALNFVAMCALSRGEFAIAQRDLEQAARVNPTEPEIWKNLGIVHLAQHGFGDALDAFDRALGIEPVHFAARLHRGAALEQLGRVDDATAA
jgi:aspartate beta-hydroxylase